MTLKPHRARLMSICARASDAAHHVSSSSTLSLLASATPGCQGHRSADSIVDGSAVYALDATPSGPVAKQARQRIKRAPTATLAGISPGFAVLRGSAPGDDEVATADLVAGSEGREGGLGADLLVNKEEVADQQGGNHGFGGDAERLRDESDNEERHRDDVQERLKSLQEAVLWNGSWRRGGDAPDVG